MKKNIETVKDYLIKMKIEERYYVIIIPLFEKELNKLGVASDAVEYYDLVYDEIKQKICELIGNSETTLLITSDFKTFYNGKELLDWEVIEFAFLVKGLFPKVGLVALVGSSDLGKSTLARQLAFAIVMGDDSFLGFPLFTVHQSQILCEKKSLY